MKDEIFLERFLFVSPDLSEEEIAKLKINEEPISAHDYWEIRQDFNLLVTSLRMAENAANIGEVKKSLNQLQRSTLARLKQLEKISGGADEVTEALRKRLSPRPRGITNALTWKADGQENALTVAINADRDLIAIINFELCDIGEAERRQCENPKTGIVETRGSTDPGAEYFIKQLMSFYKARGGKVSANHIGAPRKKRGGDFVGFMLQLKSYFPEDISISDSAFVERIATVLRKQKRGE